MGLDDSGKRSAADFIEGKKSSERKSLDLVYRPKTLEIPAGYLQNPWMNNIIIMLSQNQGIGNIFLLNGENPYSLYPPSFAKAFTKPVLGLVTNCENLSILKRKNAGNILMQILCERIIFVSFETGEGTEELLKWIRGIEGKTK